MQHVLFYCFPDFHNYEETEVHDPVQRLSNTRSIMMEIPDASYWRLFHREHLILHGYYKNCNLYLGSWQQKGSTY